PQGSPVPGFPATYLVTLRNKGNQVIESALLSCSYNEQQMDFTSAQPTETEVNNGVIYWNYSNLMPFETRTFAFDMVIHAPTDETPVNSGDEVIVSAAAGFEFDVLPADNNFTLTQMAVNSFDPNDILCLEGDLQPTSAIGDYLHYRVRFENTGTAPAQNIVVRIPIDQQRFQLNSLQLLSASHGVRATVRDSIAEFMFRNINLDSGGHGNVLLKIRSAATLQQGDSVLNNAGIYFDYNFPILTNEAETVFSDLSTGVITADASIVMYPNPTIESVRINASSTIEKAEVFDSQGRLVEVVRFDNKKNAILATSHLASGTYILRISSASGTAVQKLIKI
ncbi:MAG: T9SS type A sorting domain-containing protein, partial [Proteobacteria bacterium]